jgi:DNA replication protein DnaC
VNHISSALQIDQPPRAKFCRDCNAPLPEGGIGWVCDTCLTQWQQRERESAEREAARRRDDLALAIGIPEKLRHVTFATLKPTPALSAVRKFYDTGAWRRGASARALTLLGPTGTGKTMAACAGLVALLPDLRSHQRFVLQSTLSRRLLDFRRVDETMEEMTQTSVLVIDDVNADADPRALSMIEEVIVVREAEGRALILTSNATPARLAEAFSDRVNDRLRSWGDVVTCTGASLRKRPEATG